MSEVFNDPLAITVIGSLIVAFVLWSFRGLCNAIKQRAKNSKIRKLDENLRETSIFLGLQKDIEDLKNRPIRVEGSETVEKSIIIERTTKITEKTKTGKE